MIKVEPEVTARGGEKLSAIRIDHREDLAQYRDDLERLAVSTIEPNPFYEPWMLLPAVELLYDAHGTFFILIFANGSGGAARLCGFFPVTEQRRHHGFPVRNISLLYHRYGYMSAPLLDRERAAETLEYFFEWCRSSARIGLVEFPALAVDGAFHQVLLSVLNRKLLWSRPEQRYTRPLYKPAATAETYLSALSGRTRKHFRRQLELLRAAGSVMYSALEPGIGTEIWIDDFLNLEASGWKGREGTALSSTEADRTYFKRIAIEGVKHGRMNGEALRLDGRMIAARVVFASGADSYLFKIAYSEEHSAYSPGALLEMESIKHGLPAGIRWTDSSTAGIPTLYDRLWQDFRTMERVLVATGTAVGELVFVTVPVARWFKRRVQYLRVPSGARG